METVRPGGRHRPARQKPTGCSIPLDGPRCPTRAARGPSPGAAPLPSRACRWKCCWWPRRGFRDRAVPATPPPKRTSPSRCPSAAANPPATLRQRARREKFQQEEALYERAGLQYIVPELREGLGEIALAAESKLPRLLEDGDLRGSLHNHSTYSDGNHTLREMATWLRDHGYEYLGICDHCAGRPLRQRPQRRSRAPAAPGNRPAQRRSWRLSAFSKASKATSSATAPSTTRPTCWPASISSWLPSIPT
ncbi:MAG: hypothetical protein WKG07_12205 [Hymenobacter sp.]